MDTSIVLPEITVSSLCRIEREEKILSYRINGHRKYPLNNKSQTLNTALTSNGLFLKNYGTGGLSTVSLRGHSASQTDISLDGFSVRSNMNGLYDLNLIPTFLISSIGVNNSQGSSGMTGSIGGNLDLKTEDKLYNPLALEYIFSYGSFRDIGNYFKVSSQWGKNKNINSGIKIFHHSALNNFPFTNTNQIDRPREEMTNSAFKQYGISFNNLFELKNGNEFITKFWHVNNHREIPPTLTESTSTSFQDDRLIHTIISWNKKWNNKIKTALSGRYMNEYIYYDSPIIKTKSRAFKYEPRFQLKYRINEKHTLSGNLGNELSQADVDDYESDQPQENRTYGNIDYTFKTDKIETSFTIKEEIVNKELLPFSFSGAFQYLHVFKQNNDLYFFSNFSKNYRRPTFNDLYWGTTAFSGGNPNLQPEEGWKQEIGIKYILAQKKHFISLQSSFFNSNINNWIQWVPDNTGKWTPDNIKKVWSRGLELSMLYTKDFSQKFRMEIKTDYHFTTSTNTETISSNENTLHKQLIYVPKNNGSISLGLKYKHFSFSYNNIITGKRYITTDNSSSISSNSISNIQISYLGKFKKMEIEPLFEIKNLFNTEYQIVANRPMPQIHFQGTVFFRFNK